MCMNRGPLLAQFLITTIVILNWCYIWHWRYVLGTIYFMDCCDGGYDGYDGWPVMDRTRTCTYYSGSRPQQVTSCYGNIFRINASFYVNLPVTGGSPYKRVSNTELRRYFLLSRRVEQSRIRLFETSWHFWNVTATVLVMGYISQNAYCLVSNF